MSKYESKYAVCPYYKKHDDNRIRCEGIDKDSSIHVVFGNKVKLKEFSVSYCNSFAGHRKCLVRQALNKKYGVKDDEV